MLYMPQEPYLRRCDKCGQLVPLHNSLFGFSNHWFAVTGTFALASGDGDRHLLPVLAGDGTVLCHGSPSRAQYLEGQPRDPRPEFRYVETEEHWYRSAFWNLRREHPAPAEEPALAATT